MIAVSGTHGLIGFSLMPLLARQEQQVCRLLRKPGESVSRPDIAWVPSPDWDGREALNGTSVLVHLAGENIASRWDGAKKQMIRESRINGTRSLSENLARMKKPPETFICASAVGYYGDRGDELLNESSSKGKGFLSELCAEWEQATQAARDAGIRVVNLRFGIVLSKRGGALSKMLPPFQFGAGGNLGSGKQWMSWVAEDDVAGAILHCISNSEISGAVNVVAPNAVTNATFTKALGSALFRPTIFPVPAMAARLVFGEMADELLLSSTRVVPDKLLKTGYKFKHTDIQEALKYILSS